MGLRVYDFRGYLLGVFLIRGSPTIWGCTLGSPVFANPHLGERRGGATWIFKSLSALGPWKVWQTWNLDTLGLAFLGVLGFRV